MPRRSTSIPPRDINNEIFQDIVDDPKRKGAVRSKMSPWIFSTRMFVLFVLCLQNSLFTILRRYSQGVLHEIYSKHEVLFVGEAIKMVFALCVLARSLPEGETIYRRGFYLAKRSRKMVVLALIYGAMNILSYVALRNIGAGIFTVFAQCKILTTATFSSIILRRRYSWARWRALVSLMLGVVLFTEPIWSDTSKTRLKEGGSVLLGVGAVLTEVSLSGFASIYFEKVIKTDPEQMGIWERNFQLALCSMPVYVIFISLNHGGQAGFAGGWSALACVLTLLGAAGGLLVALSIKYGDSILKTLATTGAIIISSILDHVFLDGPLTPVMVIAGTQVVIAICSYTFDATPVDTRPVVNLKEQPELGALVEEGQQTGLPETQDN